MRRAPLTWTERATAAALVAAAVVALYAGLELAARAWDHEYEHGRRPAPARAIGRPAPPEGWAP